jgi:hypothetical protein
MKAEFTILITVERDIHCHSCDHCKDYKKVIKTLLGLKRESTWLYNCDKLGVALKEEETETDSMPCKGKDWQQTNEDFEFTDEVFTIHFKDAQLSNTEPTKKVNQ